MKKIAFILFLIFSLVQVGPALCSLFSTNSTVFVVDEEKSIEKNDYGKVKDTKIYVDLLKQQVYFSKKIKIAFNLAENIKTSPCLEKLTPPPNFC